MSDIDFLIELCDLIPTKRPSPLISDWVQGRRVLPTSTPFPGPWDNARTPYLVEPMDNLGPFSGVTETYVMKGAQIGATAGLIENPIAYYMAENPAEQLLISATDDSLERWGTKRLEPVIDSCDLRGLIGMQSQAGGAKSRRTGDKTYCKTYPGGALDMASAQSAASLRSDSKRIVYMDEVDGAPPQLRTGEGFFVDVAEARTNAWGQRKRIIALSTPTKAGVSEIHRLYLSGDQRKYYVPCPHCGEMQVLRFGDAATPYGIKTSEDARGNLVVFYQCEKGCAPIFEHHKTAMLKWGQWRPTATPNAPNIRSYHISSLYSPAGMLSWLELYRKYLKAQRSPDGMTSFENLYLGEVAQERGARPPVEKVIELRGLYPTGEVPQGVLFLTMAVDVQRGSSRDAKNPARLELEVVGHGFGYRTWSIDYRVFKGAVDDVNKGAWLALKKWAEESGSIAYRRADGTKFQPGLIFIDAGDGPNSSIVYEFCAGWKNTFPSKGFEALKKAKSDGPEGDLDAAGPAAFKKYRPTKITDETTLWTISTVHYKSLIYANLQKRRSEGSTSTPPGYMEFPSDYPDAYFDGLAAEEKRRDGSFYCPTGRRNEPLDVRVYALCAADVYLENLVKAAREDARARGFSKFEADKINSRHILEPLARKLGVMR